MQVYRSFGEKKIWRLEVNINFGISFHFFFKFTFQLYKDGIMGHTH
jgi:hypothetical protein